MSRITNTIFFSLVILVSPLTFATLGSPFKKQPSIKQQLEVSLIASVINEDDDSKLIYVEEQKRMYTLNFKNPDFKNLYAKILESQTNKTPITVLVDKDLNIVGLK